MGCTCTRGDQSFAKSSYGRTAGSPMVCGSGLQMDAGLCYKPCDPGYQGVGPVCWADAAAGAPPGYPIKCNDITWATSKAACDEVTKGYAKAGIGAGTMVAAAIGCAVFPPACALIPGLAPAMALHVLEGMQSSFLLGVCP